MRFCWLLLIAASGCTFQVPGATGSAGGGQDAAPDLTNGAPPIDLGDGADADLATPPPATLQPSHVAPHYLTDGTCDLTVASTIDTANRRVDGNAVPAGCMFVMDQESGGLDVAVLAVKSFSSPGTVSVTGNRGLVIVATTTINIAGTLDGSAKLGLAGPGGDPQGTGTGAGNHGLHANPYSDAGGGGGSYGSAGGTGGIGSYMGTTVNPAAASSTYGMATLASAAPGGSGGGYGSSEACNSGHGGDGGGGGGSLQLSAGTSITISGAVNVGGGGGGGGCQPSAIDEGSGGGGGSGGAIFIESPVVMISGGLWANGGSGGGGASGTGTATGSGGNGGNGAMSQTGATIGTSGGTNGGAGGLGGTMSAAVKGGDSANGGGGGGGAGRIVVRSRAAAALNVSLVSPAAAIDQSIP